MSRAEVAIARGVVAGLCAGLPQVLIVQAIERPLGLPSDRADIGPRLVQRLAEQLGEPLSPGPKWALAALFHFGYAAGWGAIYGAIDRLLRPPPALAGALLGGVVYAVAFSPWGAGTRTRSERHPRRREWREHLLHWTAALSFSLTTAYACAWLRAAGEERSSGSAGRPTRTTAAAGAGRRGRR